MTGATPSFHLPHFPRSIPPPNAAPAPVLAVAILRPPPTTVVADLTLTLRPPPLTHPSPLFPTPPSPHHHITALATYVLSLAAGRASPSATPFRGDDPHQAAPPHPPPPPFPSTFTADTFTPSRPICCSATVARDPPSPGHHPARLSPQPSPYSTCMHKPCPSPNRPYEAPAGDPPLSPLVGWSLPQLDAFLTPYPQCPSPGLDSLATLTTAATIPRGRRC